MLPNGLSGELDVRMGLQWPPGFGCCLMQLVSAPGRWHIYLTHLSVCQGSAELLAAVIGLPEMASSPTSLQLWLHNAFSNNPCAPGSHLLGR